MLLLLNAVSDSPKAMQRLHSMVDLSTFVHTLPNAAVVSLLLLKALASPGASGTSGFAS